VSVPILELRQVSKRYGGRAAVDGASFQLGARRITCLLGPSGCGKSTLLRLIAGLEPIDEGEIRIGDICVSAPGLSVAPEDRGVGLVFQDCALFPHLDVAGNVGFGLTAMAAAERQERVTALLQRFHIETLAVSWPHTLSGGEQQRVAIARAMAREPDILLLDEPFSSLDGHLRAQVRQSVLADLRRAGATVVVVTHDPEEAMSIADDMILMSRGHILQIGAPDECYRRPASIEAGRLLGDAVILPARVAAGTAHTAVGDMPAPGLDDGAASVFVRPEALRLDESGMPACVVATEFAGPFHSVEVEIGSVRAKVRVRGTPPPVGARVGVSLDPELSRVFPLESEGG